MNVRGVRNIPCETKPGKRAPTVEMCESDEQYVPLNDGLNWKGDPNATLSGQGVPQYAPGLDPRLPPPRTGTASRPGAAVAPPVSVPYDPATGDYIGPDGKRVHTGRFGASRQQDLAVDAGPADALARHMSASSCSLLVIGYLRLVASAIAQLRANLAMLPRDSC